MGREHLAETPLAKRHQRNVGFGKNALHLCTPSWGSAKRILNPKLLQIKAKAQNSQPAAGLGLNKYNT